MRHAGPLPSALVLLGVVLLALTLLLPWTNIQVSLSNSSGGASGTISFDTFYICTQVTGNASAGTANTSSIVAGQCVPYSTVFGAVHGAGRGLEVLLDIGWALLLAGLALAAVGGVLGLRREKGRGPGLAPASMTRRPYALSRTGPILALVGGIFLFLLFTLAASGISNAA